MRSHQRSMPRKMRRGEVRARLGKVARSLKRLGLPCEEFKDPRTRFEGRSRVR